MRGETTQTKSGFSASFQLILDGNQYGTAEIANNVTFGGSCRINLSNGSSYTLAYDTAERLSGIGKSAPNKNLIPYKIINSNNEKCGLISIKETGGFFLKRYSYCELTLNEITYTIYTVGLGKHGIKYPFYIGERQIAQVEKDVVVKDNLDTYKVYAVDEQAAFIAFLFSLHTDMVSASNRAQVVTSSVEKSYLITMNKELKQKYNPDFIKNL